MYKCQICQQIVPAKTKAQRVVMETHPRRYPSRLWANRGVKEKVGIRYPHDMGGLGYETVREVIVCPACAEQHAHH